MDETIEEDDNNDPRAEWMRWKAQLDICRNNSRYKKFLEEGEKIVRTYASLNDHDSKMLGYLPNTWYNTLWMNVQTLKPTYYARTPKPVIERRIKDSDEVKRLAAEIAERCSIFDLDLEEDNFNQVIDSCVEDLLLPGLGIAWIRYQAEYSEQQDENGAPIFDDFGQPLEEVVLEKTITEYIPYDKFYWSPAGKWSDVNWVAKSSLKSRKEIISMFGKEVANQISYTDYDSIEAKKYQDANQSVEGLKKAEIIEIWDKEKREVLWFSPTFQNRILKKQQDPLQLQEFFPCPEPLLATTTNSTLIPTAYYATYRQLDQEKNLAIKRIVALEEMVRVVGFAPAEWAADFQNLSKVTDGTFMPIKNWQAYAGDKGGLSNMLDWFPIQPVIAAIQQLMEYIRFIDSMQWEITGLPDIVRGYSNPNDTATAQQFKGRFATLRLEKKQMDVQRFCRDLLNIKYQIIFNIFTDKSISEMAAFSSFTEEEQAQLPLALGVLRQGQTRLFKLKVETDSTIALDEEAEKNARMEYLQAFGQMISNTLQVIQTQPELLPVMIESLDFGVGAFRSARMLQASVHKAGEEIQKNMKAAQEAPPEPSLEERKMQNEQMLVQLNAQLDQQKAEHKFQLDEMTTRNKAELEAFKTQNEIALKEKDSQVQLALEAQKVRLEMMQEALKAQTEYQNQLLETLREGPESAKVPNLTIVVPNAGKKMIRWQTDPVTGDKVGISEDIPETVQ